MAVDAVDVQDLTLAAHLITSLVRFQLDYSRSTPICQAPILDTTQPYAQLQLDMSFDQFSTIDSCLPSPTCHNKGKGIIGDRDIYSI